MGIKEIFLLLYLFTAVLEDFRSDRIPNWWILFGLGMGVLSMAGEGRAAYADYIAGCIIPFVLLIVLYALRVLGAGDVKLFMVTGLFLGRKEILWVMVWSFVFGGIYAFIKLIRGRCFRQRFSYLFHYVKRIAINGKPEAYVQEKATEEMLLHFSLCILLGSFFMIGGSL
jgi:prepilin peptidase CpaA